jgi:hypothetical protein
MIDDVLWYIHVILYILMVYIGNNHIYTIYTIYMVQYIDGINV